MKTKSLFVAAIFIWAALFIGTAFAQDNNENEAILQRTQEFYNNGNYLKAIESINQAIDLKENQKAFPEKVRLMAEASYFEYIDAMQKEAAAKLGISQQAAAVVKARALKALRKNTGMHRTLCFLNTGNME